MEPVRGQARDHSVIQDEAILAEQDTVTQSFHRECGERVDVDAVEKFGGIGTHHLDLAEGRSIENTDSFTHGLALACDRRVHAFAAAWKIVRALPGPHILEYRPVRFRPAVDRRRAYRIEERPPA